MSLKTDKTVKGIAAAVAMTLALMAGTVFTVLAVPGEEEEGDPTSQVTTQTTSGQTVTSRESSSQKPSSSEEEDLSSSRHSSSHTTSEDGKDESSSETATSRDTRTSRDEEPVTSRKQNSSKSGGTLTPDAKDPNSEFDDISWGAQYVEETSVPDTVSTAKPISKDIDNYYAIALKWIWLPILLICASLFGLIAVNYKAVKEKRLAGQTASRGQTSEIPMRSGRPDRRAGRLDDDDVFIASDTSLRPASRNARQPARRTPPSHARKKGPRRPRD